MLSILSNRFSSFKLDFEICALGFEWAADFMPAAEPEFPRVHALREIIPDLAAGTVFACSHLLTFASRLQLCQTTVPALSCHGKMKTSRPAVFQDSDWRGVPVCTSVLRRVGVRWGKKQLRSNASGISPHIHCGKWNLLLSATWPWARALHQKLLAVWG